MHELLTWLVISDIHLGMRNRTTGVLDALRWFFSTANPKYHLIQNINILFIAGDVFDDCLSFKSSEVHDIIIWIDELLAWASRRNVVVRVLEGTRSHDHFQSRIFEVAQQIGKYPIDLRYIDQIEVEEIDLSPRAQKVTCLYVPDNYGLGAVDNRREVADKMSQMGLSQVDIGIMHGFFDFQIPNAEKKKAAHSVKEYLSIVKSYVCIGHDHVFKTHSRAIVQGSFDRGVHGEEAPKGAVYCWWEGRKHLGFDFIENLRAKKYLTYDLPDADVDVSLSKLEEFLTGVENDSYIRLRSSASHPVYKTLDAVKVRFPFWNFSKISVEDESQKDQPQGTIFTANYSYSSTPIHKDNIVELVMRGVTEKSNLSKSHQLQLVELLEGLK